MPVPIWTSVGYLLSGVGVDGANTLFAPNKTTLDNYLLSKKKTPFKLSDYSFIRPDKTSKNAYNTGCVHVASEYDDTIDCDIVAFKNSDISDRWLYGRVTTREYVNPNSTRLYFDLDYWLSYYDLLQPGIDSCFVERTHIKQSTDWNDLGQPTFNYLNRETYEPSMQEYLYSRFNTQFDNINSLLSPIAGGVYATSDIDGNVDYDIAVVNGVPSYLYYTNADNIDHLGELLKRFAHLSTVDTKIAIQNIQAVCLIPYGVFLSSKEPYKIDFNMAMPTRNEFKRSDGLPLQNAKCLIYPYFYITVISASGDKLDLIPQLFTTKEGYLKGEVVISGGYPFKANFVPHQIDDTGAETITEVNATKKVSLPPYPLLPVPADGYAQWRAQNQASTAVQFLGGVAQAGFGAGIGGITGGSNIVNGVTKAGSAVASAIDAKNKPDQAVGASNDLEAFALNQYRFIFYLNKPNTDELTRFDNYLTRYGYTLNTYMKPDLCVRQYFTYVKCGDTSIKASVPSEGIEQVKSMLQNGCTFWNCEQGDIGDLHVENPDI